MSDQALEAVKVLVAGVVACFMFWCLVKSDRE